MIFSGRGITRKLGGRAARKNVNKTRESNDKNGRESKNESEREREREESPFPLEEKESPGARDIGITYTPLALSAGGTSEIPGVRLDQEVYGDTREVQDEHIRPRWAE